MTMNGHVRRMNYTGMSPEQRAAARRVIETGLATIDPAARPELAEELKRTLEIFDDVDGEGS